MLSAASIVSYKSVKGASHDCKRPHSDAFFFFLFIVISGSLGISCESSANYIIYMRYQDLFTLRNEGGSLECCLLQVLFDALRVKRSCHWIYINIVYKSVLA